MNTPKKRHHLVRTAVKFRPNALRHGYASYRPQQILTPLKVVEAMGATGHSFGSRRDLSDIPRMASADANKA